MSVPNFPAGIVAVPQTSSISTVGSPSPFIPKMLIETTIDSNKSMEILLKAAILRLYPRKPKISENDDNVVTLGMYFVLWLVIYLFHFIDFIIVLRRTPTNI